MTWNEKDVNHPFKTMILTSVTMLGLADVSDTGVTSDVDMPSTYLVLGGFVTITQNVNPACLMMRPAAHACPVVATVQTGWLTCGMRLKPYNRQLSSAGLIRELENR